MGSSRSFSPGLLPELLVGLLMGGRRTAIGHGARGASGVPTVTAGPMRASASGGVRGHACGPSATRRGVCFSSVPDAPALDSKH